MEFSTDLKSNLTSLKNILVSEDVLTYSFQTLDGVACAIVYADGMVNKQLLGELVAKPLSELNLLETLELNSKFDGGRYEPNEVKRLISDLLLFPEIKELQNEVTFYGFQKPAQVRKIMEKCHIHLFTSNYLEGWGAVVNEGMNSGLAEVAAEADGSVLFVYPTCEGGWKNATEELYAEVIASVKMDPNYSEGIVKLMNFFTGEFKGYFARGAIFRADIYSFGASADYVATHLLKTVQGEYLWGPGEITPAMATAVAQADAKRILLPFNHCENIIVGVTDYTIGKLLQLAMEEIKVFLP